MGTSASEIFDLNETFIIISAEIFLAEVLIISITKLFPKRMN